MFGQRQILGLALLHDAILQLSTPQGTFTPYPQDPEE